MQGTQVQATILHYNLIAVFAKKLEVGNVYKISNFTVIPAANTYRPVSGEYVISFHRKTIFESHHDIPTIPKYKFEMATFEEARSRKGDIVTLMDVAGKLITVSDIQTTNGGKKIVDIVLTNERSDTIKITLWENQALAFIGYEYEYKKPNVFVVVTSTSSKSIRGGEIVLWSSSSTQYFFNIDHPAVEAIRENSIMTGDILPIIVPSVKTQRQAMIESIKSFAIEQLFDVQLPDDAHTMLVSTEATVIELLPNYGWYYIACSKCNKKLNDSQECTKCNHNNTTPVPRYKVTAKVEDSTSDTTLVLFDRHITKLISVSAQHILDNDKNATPKMIPTVLNNILGKRYIFHLNLTKYNTVEKREDYTVTEVEEVSQSRDGSADKNNMTEKVDEQNHNKRQKY